MEKIYLRWLLFQMICLILLGILNIWDIKFKPIGQIILTIDLIGLLIFVIILIKYNSKK